MKKIYFLLFVFSTFCLFVAADQKIELKPGWVRPDAFSRFKEEQSRHQNLMVIETNGICECPPPPPPPECKLSDDSVRNSSPKIEENIDPNKDLSLVMYKKFINWIFASDKLKYDQHSSYILSSVQLKVTESQLNNLKKATDIREIDGIISDIVLQSRDSFMYIASESVCSKISHIYVNLMNSEYYVYFMVVSAYPILFIVLRFLSRTLNLNAWVIIVSVLVLITFTSTYMECNERLELDAYEKVMRTKGRNPCEYTDGRQKGVFSPMFSYLWGGSNLDKCIVHRREMIGSKRLKCDPSHVVMEVVAKLQLKYLEVFLINILGMFKNITKSSGLIESAVLGVVFICLIYLLVKFGMKYSIYGFFSFLTGVNVTAPPLPQLNGTFQQPIMQQAPPTPAPVIIFKVSNKKSKKVRQREESRVEQVVDAPQQPQIEENSKSPEKVEKRDEDKLEIGEQCTIQRQLLMSESKTLELEKERTRKFSTSDSDDIVIESVAP